MDSEYQSDVGGKMNALAGGRTVALFNLYKRVEDRSSQAGGQKEDSGFQKMGTSVVARQALEETGTWRKIRTGPQPLNL